MLLAAAKDLQPLALVFTLGVVAVLFLMGLSFAAFVLKAACRLVGAEVPDTGRAMVVSFLESLAGGMAYGLAVITVALIGVAVQAERATMSAFAGFSLVTLAFVVPAGLYVPMLRVSFSKGLAIAVVRYVITLSIFAAVGFALMAGTGKYRLH